MIQLTSHDTERVVSLTYLLKTSVSVGSSEQQLYRPLPISRGEENELDLPLKYSYTSIIHLDDGVQFWQLHTSHIEKQEKLYDGVHVNPFLCPFTMATGPGRSYSQAFCSRRQSFPDM